MTSSAIRIKPSLMAAVIAIALLVAVAWCYLRLSDARSAAASAAQDLADCRTLATRIQSLRRLPSVAGASERGAADLSRQIERAAQSAEFREGSIERIEPQSPRRVGETNYRAVSTQVRMRDVNLRQVFTFLHSLCSNSLHLSSIRLSAPRGDENSDRWTVETTLSYLVYSPRLKDGASASALQ